MASDPEMATLNRTLKEISNSFQKLGRVMEAVNTNLLELTKSLLPPEDPPMRQYYGLYDARIAEAEEKLIAGDIMCDADGMLHYWADSKWSPLHRTPIV